MSAPVSIRESGVVVSTVHLMPCKIKCTCDQEEGKELCRHPANVDTFLDPVIRKIAPEGSRDNGVECLDEGYSATFRGRPLSGRLVTVPDGYMGRVLSKRGLERHGEDEVRPY